MNYVFNGSWDCEYDKITKLIIPKGSLDEGFFTHVLPRFTQLESLVINPEIRWKWLKNADLHRLKSLYITVDGAPTFPLKAENLAVLSVVIHSEMEDYSREELYAIDRRRYDFSGVPKLTFLRISGWYSLDMRSFDVLCNLRELVIGDKGTDDLSWLSEKYSLISLDYSGDLISLNGIEAQPKLEYLHLAGNFISDKSPLASLKNLKEADLRNNPIK